MDNPQITVLMSVYNGDRFLAETLDSVLIQTRQDFEIVVIDDGSTDSSLAILERYAENDPRIVYRTGPNRGIFTALNQGIALARGKYIAKLDADDICLPTRLEIQARYLDEHPDVVGIGCWYQLIDAKGRLLTTLCPPTDNASIQAKLSAGHGAITHSCGMMRRDAMEKIGGYDPTYPVAGDLDMWLRLGELGQLANLPEPLVRFRLHAKSISERRGVEQRKFARAACEAAWKRRGIVGSFEADQLWRPSGSRASRHEFALKFGWWAFNSGQRLTAVMYALHALRALPLRGGGWNLLVSAAIKPAPRKPSAVQSTVRSAVQGP